MGRRRIGWVVSGLVVLSTAVTVVASSLSPAQAAFPGQNGRIVFDTVWSFWNGGSPSSQIYSVQPDGGGMRRLTEVGPGSAAWHPAVSPNAARIAYVLSAEGTGDQVWTMRSDGSGQRLLVDEPEWSDTSPSFTADGNRVVYSRCGSYVAFYRTCKIVSVKLDGSDQRTIIGGLWHPTDPVMSPDGSTIAYVSDDGGYDARIWLADADGRHQRVVGPNTILVERLSWSPDGTRLVLTDARNARVLTIRVDGTGLRPVVSDSIFGAWSPDGARIVSKFTSQTDFDGPLRSTRPDGSGPVTIVPASFGVGYSDWGIAR
jgi:Tol biopolymer transport system component